MRSCTIDLENPETRAHRRVLRQRERHGFSGPRADMKKRAMVGSLGERRPDAMIRTYSFRLYPTRSQGAEFVRILDACRDLYNAALQQRRDAWRMQQKSLSFFTQSLELKEVCSKGAPWNGLRQPMKHSLQRLDQSYMAFFRRVKAGGPAGFPRFRAKSRFHTFETDRFRATDRRLKLLKMSIRWKPWRDVPPKESMKLVRITRKADGWYAAVVCEVEPKPLPATGKAVGLDLGLLSLVATSDGEMIPVDPALRLKEISIRRWQRKLARQKKGSNRRKKTKKILAKHHLGLNRSRKAHLDVVTRKIINKNDIIVVEDLGVQALSRSGGKNAQGRGLRRSVQRASWGKLLAQISVKAEEAGRVVVRVDPRGTSQECSGCGAVAKKVLSERTHRCPCGLTLNRDVNAAIVILQRGLRLLRGGTAAVSASQRTEKSVEVAHAV